MEKDDLRERIALLRQQAKEAEAAKSAKEAEVFRKDSPQGKIDLLRQQAKEAEAAESAKEAEVFRKDSPQGKIDLLRQQAKEAKEAEAEERAKETELFRKDSPQGKIDLLRQQAKEAKEAEQEEEKEPEVVPHSVTVETSDSGLIAYVKLVKSPDEKAPPITKEDILEALAANKIEYGIKEASIDKLVARPIYGLRIEIAAGEAPIDGEDGHVDFRVLRDSEYKPEIAEEGTVDYKNLDYFQLVSEGDLLCAIAKESEGVAGMNVYGQTLPARGGRPAISPKGKNTSFNEDETILFADCDGIIRFSGNVVEVNDILRISGDVDMNTGNIRFSGDVIISGDVCGGFSVQAGGSIAIMGVVEDASIESGGDVQIAKGINGGSKASIMVSGSLRCKYIESAQIVVYGDLVSDYIIDSNVTCMGNMMLTSGRGVLVGGTTKLRGELTARNIGSEREKATSIEILGVSTLDAQDVNRLSKEREANLDNIRKLQQLVNKFNDPIKSDEGNPYQERLNTICQQLELLKDRNEKLDAELAVIKTKETMEYFGAVVCRNKLYHGVKINFGEMPFRFNLDSLDYCRISFADGEIIQSVL